LKPLLMAVLLRLAAAPQQVVRRETLLAEVWPRRMVNDDVLSRAIADLRTALGDDAREARFIETIPKLGYRLIAPVEPVIGAGDGAVPAAAHAARRPLAGPHDAQRPSGSHDATAPRAASSGRWHRARWIAAAGIALAIGVAGAGFWATLRSTQPTAPALDRTTLERQLAQAEPFASETTLEVGPRFSPDDRHVAYAEGTGPQSRIVVRTRATGERRTLGDPQHLNLSPVFFPDGRRLAYFRRDPAGACAIVAQDLAGGATETLLDCARKPRAHFDLTPDGARLVYVAVTRPQFPAGLLVRDLATGKDRVLTAPDPGMGDDLYPRVSPDGQRVSFFRGDASHRQLWLAALDDHPLAQAAGSPSGLAYGAAWLGPQGPLLVAADWFGQRALNLFDPRDGSATMVGARGARFPDAGRDGTIVFENAVYSANLYLVDLAQAGTPAREVWPSTRYTNQPDYAPDGRHVLFISNRDGAAGLFVATPDGPATPVPLSDDFVYLRPHWSLDGRSIYAIRANRRQGAPVTQQAIRVAWPEGALEVLTALGDRVSDVREADGGRQWIVGEGSGSAVRLLRVDPLAPGEATRLPLPLVSEFQVAGDRLAYLQPQLAGLTLCTLATMHCAPLKVPVGEHNRFDWLLTSDAVWYRAGTAPDELVRFDLARQRITWRSALAPTAFGRSFALRPDGGAMLVAREGPLAIDLMLAPRVAPAGEK
jgi:DNA-binding winged helix-turn-helix (wHTH) protein/Tol biopolymer transport system component